MAKVTKEDQLYKMSYRAVTIPKGTPVIPATNLPSSSPIKYWVEGKWWEGIGLSDDEIEMCESWHRNYGFGMYEEDVEDSELYEVLVGNVGNVYTGHDPEAAEYFFEEYAQASRDNRGRAANEPVTMMRDGEPINEYIPVC